MSNPWSDWWLVSASQKSVSGITRGWWPWLPDRLGRLDVDHAAVLAGPPIALLPEDALLVDVDFTFRIESADRQTRVSYITREQC
jgi:hypothetical protein